MTTSQSVTGSKGYPKRSTRPSNKPGVQQCVVHLIHNSFRYAGRQHRGGIVRALKPVYMAPSEAGAKDRFEDSIAEWGQRYPAIMKFWDSA